MEKWFVFQNVAKWFRLIEISFALLALPWLYSKLPFVAKAYALFVNHLIAIFTKPIFIFIIITIILITLYMKSGQVAEDLISGDNNANADLYQEITFYSTETFSLAPQEIVYQDKEMIDVVSEVKEELFIESVSEKVLEQEDKEKFVEVWAEAEEEELSSEEFKRTIEEFIAKQIRFHKEERLAIVAC